MNTLRHLFAAAFAAALISGTQAIAATTFEGSVDMTITQDKTTMSMTYYIKDTKIRMESRMPASGKKSAGDMNLVSLADTEKREVYLLMPDEKMYMVMQMPDPDAAAQTAAKSKTPAPVQFKPTGRTETIAGLTCEQYVSEEDKKARVITEMWVTKELGKFVMQQQGGKSKGGMFGKGGKPDPKDAWQAFAEKNGFFTMRVVQRKKAGAPEDFRLEVNNITRAAQPDSRFDIPPGYKKFEIPKMGDMLKGLMNG